MESGIEYINYITADNLADYLKTTDPQREPGNVDTPARLSTLFILDCRPAAAFDAVHIRRAINVNFPPILYKRLTKGTLLPQSIIPSGATRELFSKNYGHAFIVLIDEHDTAILPQNNGQPLRLVENLINKKQANKSICDEHCVTTLLFKKLSCDNKNVFFIEGGLAQFVASFPDLCQISAQAKDNFHSGVVYHFGSGTGESSSAPLHRKVPSTKPPFVLLSPFLDMRSLQLVDNDFGGRCCGHWPSSYCDADSESPSNSSIFSRDSNSVSDSVQGIDATAGASSADLKGIQSLNDNLVIGQGRNKNRKKYEDNSKSHDLHLPRNQPTNTSNSQSHSLDSRFPVEIIPHLFLGNSTNSADKETLLKYNIKYILNVTPDLPNVFENDSDFRYLKLPIYDHWSQDLLIHFPAAIHFIDEARQKNCGVLVHCLAGISRSVTVTVAYLMRTLSLSLEDAYDLVKDHKPNIAPNLNFMGQLLHFQRDLYGENIPHPANYQRHKADHWDQDYKRQDEPYAFTPLSAPPQRREGRPSKTFAECF